MESLPVELLQQIASHLDAKSDSRLHAASRSLYNTRIPYAFSIRDDLLEEFLESAPLGVIENHLFNGITQRDLLLTMACRRGIIPLLSRFITQKDLQRVDFVFDEMWVPGEIEHVLTDFDDDEDGLVGSLLDIAVLFGQSDVCRLLLQRGAASHCNLLYLAISVNSCPVCQVLLESGLDPNKQDASYIACLYLAMRDGTLEIAQLLLQYGATFDQEWLPDLAQSVAEHGRLDKVKFLFEHEQVRVTLREHAMRIAKGAAKNTLEVLQYLLTLLEEGTQQTDLKDYAMMETTAPHRRDKMIWLLQKGALIDGLPDEGWSPLYDASLNHDLELIQFLLKNGASLHIGNQLKHCPLQAAVAFKNSIPTLKLLLQKDPALMEWSCRDGQQSPLHTASIHCELSVYQFLVEHGARVNAVDQIGVTPLLALQQNLNLEICHYLIQHGADFHHRDQQGEH